MKKDKLKILYEDKYLIIINKPNNLLMIATEKEKENTLYHKVLLYLKKKNQKVFIVNRLDKDTSGIVIFAKNEKVKRLLQDNWNQVIRKYMAIIYGNLEKKEDTLKSYLMETKTNLVYSTNDSKKGKLAITSYKVIYETDKYSLLDINIKTGRKNQIRVALNDIKHPIVGDKKYYQEKQNTKRLYLHSYYIEFNHPITKQLIKIELEIPTEFIKLLNYNNK